MKLIINGPLNRYYVQTLCMMFFPGSKFSENEEVTPDTPVAKLTQTEDDAGIRSVVTLSIGEKSETAEGRCEFSEGFDVQKSWKISAGRAFYECGAQLLGVRPPWGILTGVRPAKVASKYLLEGNKIMKTRTFLRSEYFLNPKKASLVTDVAVNELRIIRSLPENLCSVYISIPFCPSRCAYCSFVSYTSKRLLDLIPEYLSALKDEIKNRFAYIRSLHFNIATIYIGGGTPTILNESQLEDLLSFIAKETDVASLYEFTLEGGRPDTITAEKLRIAAKYGVTRISVNPQTINNDVLKDIGRHHTVEEFFRAYDLVAASGIPHINCDLIAGLPGDSFYSYSKSVDRLVEMRPDNLTFHTFCVKKSSDLLKSETNYFSITGGDTGKYVDYSQMRAKNSGYKPYYVYRNKNTVGNLENVGYALDGCEGLYNIFMMEEVHPVFGCGAGAVTRLTTDNGLPSDSPRIERVFNPKYPYEYLGCDRASAMDSQNRIMDTFFYGDPDSAKETETEGNV